MSGSDQSKRCEYLLIALFGSKESSKASSLALLLAKGEADIAAGRSRPIRGFLRDFKNAHKTSLRSHGK